jgi:hypothetical protein
MRKLLLFCWLVLLPAPLLAQQGTPRALAEQFLSSVQKGQIAAAYAKLFEGSNIRKDTGTGMAIRRQTEAMLPLFGKVLSYELVHEEQIGTALVRLVYVLKSERHLTAWEFYFYRPGNRWFVAEVNFGDKLDRLRRTAN